MNQITVVMALYKPNLKWLQEELESIERQSYREFSVIAWNDSPDDAYDYDSFFKKYMPSISFQIIKGEKNLGSNGAFEQLTKLVKTPYIAYCDQDDIWESEKLEILFQTIQSEDATLVFSDMKVIDGNSNVIASHIREVRPRQIFYTGPDALEHLLVKNFVTGCTMMMKTSVAKAALPFPSSVFHDWWLAVYAAANGKIAMASKPLMKYRIYGGNQSAVLAGVSDKSSYYEKRIASQREFIQFVSDKIDRNQVVENARMWCQARCEYFKSPSISGAKNLMKQSRNNSWTTYFELILPFMPNIIFNKIIGDVKKGNL